jgi:hypothetical protein
LELALDKASWSQVLVNARALLDFLNQSAFFGDPYRGDQKKAKLIFDASLAAKYSTNDSGDQFEDWQSLLESVTPSWPDMPRSVEKRILEVLDLGRNAAGHMGLHGGPEFKKSRAPF